MTSLITGTHLASGANPQWQRNYYEMLLLETLRTKSILVPFTAYKEDFNARHTGTIVYTEVFDTEPDWSSLAETDIWLRGAHLDTQTISVDLEIHGDVLKYSDYSEVVQYVNSGNMKGLVRNKIGLNQKEYLDILARNAFLSHPNKIFADSKTSRAALATDSLFEPSLARLARLHLEENEVPGVANPYDGGAAIVCVTTPRVIYDIQEAAGSEWKDAQLYEQTGRLFTGEVGMWGGVRFVKSMRMRLRNAGAVTTETTLAEAIAAGDGASSTVDTVYSPGQTGSNRTIAVTSSAGFVVGDYVTISAAAKGGGVGVPEADGTQETRRITAINTNDISFNKPFMKAHPSDDYMTKGIDVHASAVIGGPGVAFAVGERPNVFAPPKYDDLMMINRVGWRGFLKMQLWRPEFFEVIESAGSTD